MASSNSNDDVKYNTLFIDEDHKKKIESTQFVYVVAPSGVGKSFTGDYLEAIQGWKHIDGDCIMKNKHLNEHWKNLFAKQDKLMDGKSGEEQMAMAVKEEFYQPMVFEHARLLLEGAKESSKVVLTNFTFFEPHRLLLRKYLTEAGVKEEHFTMMFLHCDRDVHNNGAWKRWNFQAECAGCSIEDLFKTAFEMEGIVDFDSFVTIFQDGMSMKFYQDPQESERPYMLVDVTARDITVLDKYDKTLGLENSCRKDLTYDEMVKRIKTVDQERDKIWGEGLAASKDATEKEKELALKEPKKYVARRSSLFEAEKLDTIRCMSAITLISDNDGNSRRYSAASEASSNSKARRVSFIETGKSVEL